MVKTRKQAAEETKPSLSKEKQAAINKRWADVKSKKQAAENKKKAQQERMKKAKKHRWGVFILCSLLLMVGWIIKTLFRQDQVIAAIGHW
jgi:cation transport ATPase